MRNIITAIILMALSVTGAAGADRLGLSYSELMVDMDHYFTNMKWTSYPKDYAGSYYGKFTFDDDHFASYTIYGGDKSDAKSVSLYVPVAWEWANDDRLTRSILLLMICLRNAVPAWADEAGRNEWLTSSMESLLRHPNLISGNRPARPDSYREITRDYGNKRIRLRLISGQFLLTIDPL